MRLDSMTNEELVRRAYDNWAESYDSIDNPLIAMATVALASHSGRLAGSRVLELGCGSGRNAVLCLAAGAAKFAGIDSSPGMLAIARGRVSAETWIQGDLTTPAGSDHDVVLISLVLEHVADVTPVIAAAARALAPGGTVIILELHPDLHSRGVGANFRIGEEEIRLPSFRHDGAELSAALAAAGLGDLRVVDHVPGAEALARSPKLARYRGENVLLEVTAQRAGGAATGGGGAASGAP